MRTDAELEAEGEKIAVRMRAAGVGVSFDLRACSDMAANLLCWKPKTSANWRGATPTYRLPR